MSNVRRRFSCTPPHSRLAVLALVAGLLSLPGCGGGGGSSGPVTPEGGEVSLARVAFGRGLLTEDGLEIVSPLTTVTRDPQTRLDIRSSLEGLDTSVELGRSIDLELGEDYRPIVIPRDGILMLEFTAAINESTVVADSFDEAGNLVEAGSVRIRDAYGKAVPVALTVRGEKVFIDPRAGGRTGFPKTPLSLNIRGEAEVVAGGFLRLTLPRTGDHILEGRDGQSLVNRGDSLGANSVPIGFHPGNEGLDFIEQNDLLPQSVTYNGHLPDLDAPRIARDYIVEGVVTGDDSVAPNSIYIDAADFDDRSNNGFGEWARAFFTLRPGEEDEERHRVEINDQKRVTLVNAFSKAPAFQDRWRLSRVELFEPVSGDPIDPDRYDALNPQNKANEDLRSFVWFDEIDAQGNVSDVNGDGKTRYTAHETVPARSVLRVKCDEPVDSGSCLPFESFRVDESLDGVDSHLRLGSVAVEDDGYVIAFWPQCVDQVQASGSNYFGFGEEDNGERRVVIRAAPGAAELRSRLTPGEFLAYQEMGYVSVTDLGGLPLALPESLFDRDQIFVEYDMAFSFEKVPGPSLDAIDAVVHLFQGQPEVVVDGDTGEPAARYRDHNGLFGPMVNDLNLETWGRLASAAKQYTRRIVDDTPGNNPPDSDFEAFGVGSSTPLSGIWGARFQHVYRREEASLSPSGDLAGWVNDLYRISFAPIGGNVTGPDVYEDISIHAAHSIIRPVTTSGGGGADEPESGLGVAFDPQTFENDGCGSSLQEEANYFGPLRTCVSPGTQFVVVQKSLVNFEESQHRYHPWPEFANTFSYDNDNSLVLEYRIRPQEATVSFANGFTYSPARRLTPEVPRFRVFSVGGPGGTLNPDPETSPDNRSRCAVGPLNGDFGDFARYFCAFDYVKLKSRIVSPFMRAESITDEMVSKGIGPSWKRPVLDPPLSELERLWPVQLQFRAVDDPDSVGQEQGWTEDYTALDGLYIQFRLIVELEKSHQLTPSLGSIYFPYGIPE